MESVYMAIWYKCNQLCTGCPCSRNVDKAKNMNYEDIKNIVDKLTQNNDEPISITVSGGEPTLHPDFLKIMKYFRSKDVFVTILSNAEKFADISFCDDFLNSISILRTRIVTTIHSSDAFIHEEQNHSKGSFEKSLKGLKYLFHRGVGVTVKHCITSKNYKDTLNFIKFIDDEFHPSVNIQLFGFDYCGLTKAQAQDFYCHYTKMQPYLEAALDKSIELTGINGRNTTVYNIPLCWVDPYYWPLFELCNHKQEYINYFDPTTAIDKFNDGSGKYSVQCQECYVYDICPGTYKSMFDYFGDSAVSKIIDMNHEKEGD